MVYMRNIQVAQGVLFLVDNTGTCPVGQNFREFTDAAIAHHLTRHTYYYQHYGKAGAGNRRRATAKWFRSNFRHLWTNTKPESGYLKQGDLADALFRARSGAMTEEALNHYGYDPDTFSESDLPGFISDDGRFGSSLPPRVQGQASRVSAPQTSQDNLPGPALKRKSESPDELSLSEHAAKRPRTENPVVNADAQGSTFYMPRCKPCIESKDDCDGQRPCSRCTDSGIGLAVCTSGDLTAHKDETIVPESNIGNDQLDVEANISTSGSAQDMRPPPSSPLVGEKRGLEETGKAQQHAAKRPRTDIGDVDAEHHNATSDVPRSDQAEDQSGPSSVIASLGKRKRETGDTGINTDSNDDDAILGPEHPESSKHQATEASIEASKNNEQAQFDMSALSEQAKQLPSSVTSATDSVPMIHKKADAISVTRDEVVTQPPANQPPANKQGGFARLLLNFPVAPIRRRMSDLQEELEEAVDKLFACIGQIQAFPCPLVENPDDELEALYVRCWGAQWRTVFHDCVNNNTFLASPVIASLISGFLVDNVLTEQGPIEGVIREVTKAFEAGGAIGNDLLSRIELQQKVLDHTEESRATAVEKARTMLAQDDATLQLQLRSQAEKFTKQLWRLLKPHFHELSVTAKHFHRSAGESDEKLIEAFESSVTKLIQSALHHKLLLSVVEEGSFTYTWPSFGEEYDVDRMKPYRLAEGWRRLPKVAYTAFPGIRLTLFNGYVSKDFDSLVAAVRYWIPPHRSDFET